MTPEEALAAAWTYCAPGRLKDVPFPRGFWPDVARVAMAMHSQQTLTPTLDFRPTMCARGDAPEIRVRSGNKPQSARAAAKSRAENTALLLAMLEAGNAKV